MFERTTHLGRRLCAMAFAALAIASLAACGGSGAGAGGSAAGSGSVAGTVKVLAATTTLNSDGKTPIDLTAVVTSGSNVAARNVAVDFSVTDPLGSGEVRLEVSRGTTDASGTAAAKLVLTGDSRSRDLTVVASVSGVPSPPLTIRVAGTTLTVSGPSSLSLNGATLSNFTVAVKDSSGASLGGKAVTVSSAAGNTLSSTSLVTDAGGQAVVGVRGVVAGSDTLTFASMGETRAVKITVAGQSMSITPGSGFSTVSGTSVVAIGSSASLQVSYQAADGIPPGTIVEVSSTRGTVSPAQASIVSGSAEFTVTSSFAGPATVTARVGGVTSEFNFNFVAVTASQIDLQTSPATVGPNAAGSTDQRATLTAVVRDVSGNPVANRPVTFTAIDDPSGGSISPGVATTDLAGRATAAFIAGPTTTAPNAVRLQATVDGISSQVALLSVSRSQLFVRIGTDNLIESVAPALYKKTYAVVVTDATGNAVPNATVQMSLRPLQYRTGSWVTSGAAWSQTVTGTFPSEDIDRNGVCSVGEDTNVDGQLTPGNVASVDAATTTASNGIAAVVLQYPREFAAWVELLLEARIQVAGSEGVASAQFWLSIAASDVQDPAVSPPGEFSPFPYPSGPAISRSCP